MLRHAGWPGESAGFKIFARGMGFNLEDITAKQRSSLHKLYAQMQEREQRAAAEIPSGFEDYVQSLGFRLDDLDTRQRESLLQLFQDAEPDADHEDLDDDDFDDEEDEREGEDPNDDLDAGAAGDLTVRAPAGTEDGRYIVGGPEDANVELKGRDKDDPTNIET
jgi:hypothetical protein